MLFPCFVWQTESSGDVVAVDGGVEQVKAAVVAAPPPAPPPAPPATAALPPAPAPQPAPATTPPPNPAPPVPVAAALPVSLPPVAAAAPVLPPPNPIATSYTPSALHACCLAAACPFHGHGAAGATCAPPRAFPASGKEALLVERAVARMCAFLEGGTVMVAQNRISAPELFVSLDANRDGLLVRAPTQPPWRVVALRHRSSVAFATVHAPSQARPATRAGS